MRVSKLLLVSVCILNALPRLRAEPPVEHISVCTLQDNAERYQGEEIEVRALIFAGLEYSFVKEGNCSFSYVRGDNYQAFGNRFRVKHDAQWKRLMRLLGTTNCGLNVRVAEAKIVGTVIRTPATGTIPPEEMPLELVIQSVSEVSRVPTRCGPGDTPARESFLHETGRKGVREKGSAGGEKGSGAFYS